MRGSTGALQIQCCQPSQLIHNAVPADAKARHSKWVILLQVLEVTLCLPEPQGREGETKFQQ